MVRNFLLAGKTFEKKNCISFPLGGVFFLFGFVEMEDKGNGQKERSSNDMKVVITGATGVLGRAMMKEFSDCDVVGMGWSRADGKKIHKIDLKDFQAVEEFLIQEFPG